MEMIGQHDHRVDRERMMPPRLTKRSAQLVDMFCQQPQPSLRQIDGKKEAAPGNEVATIVGHAGTLAWSREDVTGIAEFIIGLSDDQTGWIKSPFDRVSYDGFREELNPSYGL
jgi:hypothetical protein